MGRPPAFCADITAAFATRAMSTETRTFVIVAPAVFAAGGLSASAKIWNTLVGSMSHHDFLYLPAVMALAAIPALRAQDTRNVA
jgi:hypothetical protein